MESWERLSRTDLTRLLATHYGHTEEEKPNKDTANNYYMDLFRKQYGSTPRQEN